MNPDWYNIPSELRALPQWAVATLVIDLATGKPDKSPRHPITWQRISIHDLSSWSTFDACVQSNPAAIGFLLTATDPYAVIDLDVPSPEGEAVHQRIREHFVTYSERSVSGKGTHVWLRGYVGGGRHRDDVEVYDRERFILCTGNVERDHAIVALPAQLADVLSGMPEGVALVDIEDEPQRRSDQAIAVGLAGALDQPYPPGCDKSQEDYRLLAKIVRWTRNQEQAQRLFEGSGFYRREKGAKYIPYSLSKTIRQFRESHPHATPYFIDHGRELVEMMVLNRSRVERDDGDPGPRRASTLKGKRIPQLEWLVPGLIPMKKVTLFGGDGGTGKSLLALQLAASVASGEKWLGLEVKRGMALFFSAEDDNDDLDRRTQAIAAAEAIDLDRLDDLHLWSRAGLDALLANLASGQLEPSKLYAQLVDHISDLDVALVVIDTSADVFPGDEIKRVQVRQFIQLLARVAIEHGCAVVLLSHPSVDGMRSGSGTSGSTAWNNSVRSRLYFERIFSEKNEERDPDERRLSNKKNNYNRTGTELTLRYDNGRFVVIGAPARAGAVSVDAEAVFLKLLDLHNGQLRRVNASGRDTYAPKVFAAHPASERITQPAFRIAMERLLTAGAIQTVFTGPPSRRVGHLELTPSTPPPTPIGGTPTPPPTPASTPPPTPFDPSSTPPPSNPP